MLDVESGAIHVVDDDAFAVLSALERGEDPHTGTGLPLYTVDEILSEFYQLKEQGLIDREMQEAPPATGGSVVK